MDCALPTPAELPDWASVLRELALIAASCCLALRCELADAVHGFAAAADHADRRLRRPAVLEVPTLHRDSPYSR